MTPFNLPSPRGFLVFILFIATLIYVSYIMSGCKNKQVQCEAYSLNQNWQDENWFDDDKLIQVDDTTFFIRINDCRIINIDSLCTYK